MFKLMIAAGVALSPAIAMAQLGAGMGTNAYAQPHSPEGDVASGAAGTPTHKSHVAHYDAQHKPGRVMHYNGTHSDVPHHVVKSKSDSPK